MLPCLWCRAPLRFLPGRGWTHLEGGTYVVYCPSCGWKDAPYPSPSRCPRCGSRQLRDDHCATPRRS